MAPGKKNKIARSIVLAYNRTREYKYWLRICHAPYKSLYFSFDGTVHSCCVNRQYKLGKYPENSLLDIWKGKQLKTLKRHINRRDLSLGCQECKYYLENKNYDDLRAKFYDFPETNRRFPVFMEFELSNVCNLECMMCGGNFSSLIRKNRENRPPLKMAYDDEFVDQLEHFLPHLKRAQFAGGEPFLINIYFRIWKRLIDLNPDCIIGVQSNGTVLNNRVKEILARGRFQLGFSIDSLKKEIYEKVRLNASFEETMRNLDWYASYGLSKNIHNHITVCPMRINWMEIPDLVRFCNEKQFYIRYNFVWQPEQYALWNLPHKTLSEIYNFLSESSFSGSGSVFDENIRYYGNFLKQVDSWHRDALNKDQHG